METDKIKICDQGKGWVCVEKPWGMSVHNEPGKDLISTLAADPGLGLPDKHSGKTLLQPVHRLDKETSGLLLLATTPESLPQLSTLFAQGQIHKKYMALVHGNFAPGKGSKGIWDTTLAKEAGGRKDPRGRGKKVKAVTTYQVLDQSPHYTLVEIELLTGRKHQIRRHAKLAGHPIVGDQRYGSPRAIQFLRKNRGFHRMALHAFSLEFQDGNTPVSISCNRLPRQMAALLNEDQ